MASDEPPASPDEPHLSPHEIEQLDRVLSEFKRSLQLPHGDPGRASADQNMRRIGFAVPQIIALSGEHKLRESTIKNHVKGITASSDAPAQKAIQFITMALDENVTLQTIRDFIEVKVVADANKVTMKDIIGLLQALNAQKIPQNDFINDYKQMKDIGLTPPNLKSFLDYRTRLEKNGFGLNQLKLVHDASEKYGGPEEVLKGIEEYKNFQELKNLTATAKREQIDLSELLKNHRKDQANLEREIKELKDQISSYKTTLSRLKALSDLGYDDIALRDLSASTGNLGGVKKVMTAIRKLHDVDELDRNITDLRGKKTALEEEKTGMETANAHLKAHIDATRELIEKHELGLDAISSLLRIARRYGSAADVLKAFETYEDLQKMNNERRKLERETQTSQERVNELGEKAKRLRTAIDKILPEIEKDLTTWKKQLDEKLAATTASVKSTLDSQSRNFETAMDNSGKKIGELEKKLEKDLDTVDATADKETKALTVQMRSDVQATGEDLKKILEQTATQIKSEITSILDAAHELDKAYKEREAESPKLKEFLRLVDLVDDPSRVTDITFLATIQLTLRRTIQWVNLNPSRFGYYPDAKSLTSRIEELDKMLSKVNFEPRTIT